MKLMHRRHHHHQPRPPVGATVVLNHALDLNGREAPKGHTSEIYAVDRIEGELMVLIEGPPGSGRNWVKASYIRLV